MDASIHSAEIHTAQIKSAELLSSLGDGVLGAGIALLLVKILSAYAIPILVSGLLAHAVGMFRKHALEQQRERARILWAEALFWLCWLVLAVLLILVLISQL